MKLIVFFAILALSSALGTSELQEQWSEFQQKFGKTYRSPVELKKRMAIFSENLEKINAHNQLYENGQVTWKMGVTQFTDMTEQEFLDLTTSKIGDDEKIESISTFSASPVSDAPDSIDWREKGAVTEVKNQGSCGSCWSFSATGALEGLAAVSYDRKISFSEQNLIDCATPPNATNYGCSGGFMTQAFAYVRDHGIVTEDEYPYEGQQGVCRQNRIVFQILGYVEVAQDEEALRQAVGTRGPVSVGIQSTANLQNYASGVLVDDSCTSAPNHGVLAVGYGNEVGKDYWLIKNSWGALWGENGYFKLARNMNSMCFITRMASFPTITYE